MNKREFPPSQFNQLQLVLSNIQGEKANRNEAFGILEQEERELLSKYQETGCYKTLALLTGKNELDVYFLLRRAIFKASLFV